MLHVFMKKGGGTYSRELCDGQGAAYAGAGYLSHSRVTPPPRVTPRLVSLLSPNANTNFTPFCRCFAVKKGFKPGNYKVTLTGQ